MLQLVQYYRSTCSQVITIINDSLLTKFFFFSVLLLSSCPYVTAIVCVPTGEGREGGTLEYIVTHIHIQVTHTHTHAHRHGSVTHCIYATQKKKIVDHLSEIWHVARVEAVNTHDGSIQLEGRW